MEKAKQNFRNLQSSDKDETMNCKLGVTGIFESSDSDTFNKIPINCRKTDSYISNCSMTKKCFLEKALASLCEVLQDDLPHHCTTYLCLAQ